ncbi:MAG: hypothetical protein H7222_06670 [Methylotenera sp.]|nr:hypothetical protein [Oligoflexia bacterium]
MLLNAENYSKGFLVDEELMAGVTRDPEQEGQFVAFVLRHTTGEYLGYRPFKELTEALAAINDVQREWRYENTSGCGGDQCGEGNCSVKSGGACKMSTGASSKC